MTRKTKEEKKLAEYRRRLKLLKQSSPQEKNTESDSDKTVLSVKNEPKREVSPEDIKQRLHFHKDLKKSLLFISLVITLEIIIYFATIKI